MIPKKIFQTYSSFDELHPDMKANSKKISEMHPDWEYTFFSEPDVLSFISEQFGKRFLEYYQKIDSDYGGTRADFFRYLVIFKYGGVYLDIKSGLTKHLNKIILDGDSFLCSHWPKRYSGWGEYRDLNGKPEFQNWFIISEPNHPFLALAISNAVDNIVNYDQSVHGVGKIGGIRTTGPIPYSKAIYKLKELCNYRLIDSDACGLKYSIFENVQEKLAHVGKFKKHYSNLMKPVVVASDNLSDLANIAENNNELHKEVDFCGIKITVNKIEKPLVFVCSHERSGTHFLMNSLAQNSDYSSLYLNLDPDDESFAGAGLKVEDIESIEKFFQNLHRRNGSKPQEIFSGIIKSHYHAQYMSKFISDERVFFYIYRDPVDTLLSYWRFLHNWEEVHKNVGKLGKTPAEFLNVSPTPKSQRYQYCLFENYFLRWANHVSDWIELGKKIDNVIVVRYENLKNNYTPEVNRLLAAIGYNSKKFCEKPPREAYWHGKNIPVSKEDIQEFKSIIKKRMNNFSLIPNEYR